jgi:hypothetical protein
MARHAYRVPIYSSLGGAKPLIYVSRAEAEELERGHHAVRISRLKSPDLVMRFCGLLQQPRAAHCSITAVEMELNALSQILSAGSHDEARRMRRIAQKIAAWPLVGDEKAAPANRTIPEKRNETHD